MVDATIPAGLATRNIDLVRVSAGRFQARNARGGTIDIGSGDGTEFTPVELLLAALAGCASIDVEMITGKRSEPTAFDVRVAAEKVRDEGGNRLRNPQVTFRVDFPEGSAGDAARAQLPRAVRMAHDRLCTVSRTVELPTPVDMSIDAG